MVKNWQNLVNIVFERPLMMSNGDACGILGSLFFVYDWKRNQFSNKTIFFNIFSSTMFVLTELLWSFDWGWSPKFATGLNATVQGVSHWRLQSKLALTGRRIDNFSKVCCLVASRGLYIWVSLVSFQKSNIGWPQKPPTERVQIPVFDNPFH